jgi:hypothetical protein
MVYGMVKNRRSFWVHIFLLGFLLCNMVSIFSQEGEKKKNSISIFGSAEYGLDARSIPPSAIPYRDGFFHSAGFYYLHHFKSRWYLQPGICYSQVLFSDASRTSTPVTQKVHRLGLSLSAGYYVLDEDRWSIGVGGGVQVLYNLAAVKWNGDFNENTVIHLTSNEVQTIGLEFNIHMIASYRFHPRWEIYGSPYMQMNALPIFKTDPDNTLRVGLTLGVGYLF